MVGAGKGGGKSGGWTLKYGYKYGRQPTWTLLSISLSFAFADCETHYHNSAMAITRSKQHENGRRLRSGKVAVGKPHHASIPNRTRKPHQFPTSPNCSPAAKQVRSMFSSRAKSTSKENPSLNGEPTPTAEETCKFLSKTQLKSSAGMLTNLENQRTVSGDKFSCLRGGCGRISVGDIAPVAEETPLCRGALSYEPQADKVLAGQILLDDGQIEDIDYNINARWMNNLWTADLPPIKERFCSQHKEYEYLCSISENCWVHPMQFDDPEEAESTLDKMLGKASDSSSVNDCSDSLLKHVSSVFRKGSNEFGPWYFVGVGKYWFKQSSFDNPQRLYC
ncbi:uncharacterized protein CIMG_08732 [Coccidioides immitis RS]|uniref:Uncharacterized protein n=1 Tax=Coccidioides immitis (strain RS) TaxID=246410 RepID=J3K634_COCIM|nr:uncharacterized protein CIMG_08732 [Coccidioides immitis RS]EAS29986.3 hypothetical protein CIMG_08732 [Coccidioides immitis RS]